MKRALLISSALAVLSVGSMEGQQIPTGFLERYHEIEEQLRPRFTEVQDVSVSSMLDQERVLVLQIWISRTLTSVADLSAEVSAWSGAWLQGHMDAQRAPERNPHFLSFTHALEAAKLWLSLSHSYLTTGRAAYLVAAQEVFDVWLKMTDEIRTPE